MRKITVKITSAFLILIMIMSMTLTVFAEEPSNINVQQTAEDAQEEDVKGSKNSDDTFTEDDVPKEIEDQLMAQLNGNTPSDNDASAISSQISVDSTSIMSGEDISVSVDDDTKSGIKDNKTSEPIPESNTTKLDNLKIVNDTISTTLYDGTTISISGKMPKDAIVEASEVFSTDNLPIDDNLSIIKAYDIKILYNDEYFQPEDIDSEVKVSIKLDDLKEAVAGTIDETVPVNEETITLLHIDDKENVSEIEDINVSGDTVSFDADSFSVYVLATDEKYSEITTTITSEKTVGSKTNEEELSVTATFTVDRNTSYPTIKKHLSFTGNMYEYVDKIESAGATVIYANDMGCDIDLDFNQAGENLDILQNLRAQLELKQTEMEQKEIELKEEILSAPVYYSHTLNLDDSGQYVDKTSIATRNCPNISSLVNKVNIPGATSVYVMLTYQLAYNVDYVMILNEDYTGNSPAANFNLNTTVNRPSYINGYTGDYLAAPGNSSSYGPQPRHSDEFYIDLNESNTLSFLFRSYRNNSLYHQYPHYGYYAKIYDLTNTNYSVIQSEMDGIQSEISSLQNQIDTIESNTISLSVTLKFKPLLDFFDTQKQEKIDAYIEYQNSKYEPEIALLQSQLNALNEKVVIMPAQYSHTPNIDDTGIQSDNYANSFTKTDVVTIPGAESLHVVITYGGESVNYDWVCMWEGDHPEYTAANDYGTSVTGKLGGGYHTATSNTKEYDVTGDTVTFAFKSDYSGVGDGYGYYAKVVGYKITNTTETFNVNEIMSQLLSLQSLIADMQQRLSSSIEIYENYLSAYSENNGNYVTVEDRKTLGLRVDNPASTTLNWNDLPGSDNFFVDLVWGVISWADTGNGRQPIKYVETEPKKLFTTSLCPFSYGVHMSCQSQVYAPGDIEIELPYLAFYDNLIDLLIPTSQFNGYTPRNTLNMDKSGFLGDVSPLVYSYPIDIGVPAEGQQSEGFVYKIDEDNNKIIIYNDQTISTYEETFFISYNIYPMFVHDMSEFNIYAQTIIKKDVGEICAKKSNTLSIQVDTGIGSISMEEPSDPAIVRSFSQVKEKFATIPNTSSAYIYTVNSSYFYKPSSSTESDENFQFIKESNFDFENYVYMIRNVIVKIPTSQGIQLNIDFKDDKYNSEDFSAMYIALGNHHGAKIFALSEYDCSTTAFLSNNKFQYNLYPVNGNIPSNSINSSNMNVRVIFRYKKQAIDTLDTPMSPIIHIDATAVGTLDTHEAPDENDHSSKTFALTPTPYEEYRYVGGDIYNLCNKSVSSGTPSTIGNLNQLAREENTIIKNISLQKQGSFNACYFQDTSKYPQFENYRHKNFVFLDAVYLNDIQLGPDDFYVCDIRAEENYEKTDIFSGDIYSCASNSEKEVKDEHNVSGCYTFFGLNPDHTWDIVSTLNYDEKLSWNTSSIAGAFNEENRYVGVGVEGCEYDKGKVTTSLYSVNITLNYDSDTIKGLVEDAFSTNSSLFLKSVMGYRHFYSIDNGVTWVEDLHLPFCNENNNGFITQSSGDTGDYSDADQWLNTYGTPILTATQKEVLHEYEKNTVNFYSIKAYDYDQTKDDATYASYTSGGMVRSSNTEELKIRKPIHEYYIKKVDEVLEPEADKRRISFTVNAKDIFYMNLGTAGEPASGYENVFNVIKNSFDDPESDYEDVKNMILRKNTYYYILLPKYYRYLSNSIISKYDYVNHDASWKHSSSYYPELSPSEDILSIDVVENYAGTGCQLLKINAINHMYVAYEGGTSNNYTVFCESSLDFNIYIPFEDMEYIKSGATTIFMETWSPETFQSTQADDSSLFCSKRTKSSDRNLYPDNGPWDRAYNTGQDYLYQLCNGSGDIEIIHSANVDDNGSLISNAAEGKVFRLYQYPDAKALKIKVYCAGYTANKRTDNPLRMFGIMTGDVTDALDSDIANVFYNNSTGYPYGPVNYPFNVNIVKAAPGRVWVPDTYAYSENSSDIKTFIIPNNEFTLYANMDIDGSYGYYITVEKLYALPFYDINDNGVIEDDHVSYKYVDIPPTKVGNIIAGFFEKVKGLDPTYKNYNYTNLSSDTKPAVYSYNLTIRKSSSDTVNNIIMYDILESAAPDGKGYWKGILDSIDTSSAVEKGINPKIFYSTKQGLKYPSFQTTDERDDWLTNPERFEGTEYDADWMETMPDDKSTITAIAIDLRRVIGDNSTDPDPTSTYVIPGNGSVSITINMIAPIDDPREDGPDNQYAYNQAAFSSKTNISSVGNSVAYRLLKSTIVRVGLNNTNIHVSKVWDNVSNWWEDQPDNIQVRLLADGVLAEGTTPQTLNAANSWSYTFNKMPIYDDLGSEITYTVEEISVPDNYAVTYAHDKITETDPVTGDTTEVDDPYNFIVTNTHDNDPHDIYFGKFDIEDRTESDPLSGAIFNLEYWNPGLDVTSTADATSTYTSDTYDLQSLSDGYYKLTEQTPVPNYGIVPPINFTVKNGVITLDEPTRTDAVTSTYDSKVMLSIFDTPLAELSSTGGSGIGNFTVFGLAMIIMSGMTVYYTKKRRKIS